MKCANCAEEIKDEAVVCRYCGRDPWLAEAPEESTLTDRLQLDYEQTTQLVRMLTDIRFKLLAFVPALTAAAVALLTKPGSDQATVLAVGLIGLLVTFGIVFYEMRNTTLYDAAIHRAKCLEYSLNLPLFTKTTNRITKNVTGGGLFNERAGRPKLFLGFLRVWHDRALALVYGAALGGWFFIVINSLLGVLNKLYPDTASLLATKVSLGAILRQQESKTVHELGISSMMTNLISILSAVIVASLFIWAYHRAEKGTKKMDVPNLLGKLERLRRQVIDGEKLEQSERNSLVDEEQQRPYEAQARRRVKELKGFFTHGAVYVVVNIGLFSILLIAGRWWWFYWPLLIWGIGLMVHAVYVFGYDGRRTRQWEGDTIIKLEEEYIEFEKKYRELERKYPRRVDKYAPMRGPDPG